jgi:hypothetical protein
MEPKILCYKPSGAGNYNKRQNDVKIVILNKVVINRRKNEISTPSSVKTGTHAYRCRKTLHSRRKPKDNMRGPFGDVSLTWLRIIEMIRRYWSTEKSGSCKSTVNLQRLRLNTRISCLVLSVEVHHIWNPNYDGNSSTFIDTWNANAVDVCVFSLLGLTASKKQRHCCQSTCKAEILLMAVGVEKSVFIVDSRCRRPTFRC